MYKVLIKEYVTKHVINIGDGNGACAEACLEERVGCFAVALIELHATHLETRLSLFALKWLMREDSVHYQPEYASAV